MLLKAIAVEAGGLFFTAEPITLSADDAAKNDQLIPIAAEAE
jgi:hypothetical protein